MKAVWVTWVNIQPLVYYRSFNCSTGLTDANWVEKDGKTTLFYPGDYGLWHYYINEATMTELRRDCMYEYYLANDQFVSDTFQFSGRTPEVVEPFEDNKKPVRVWIYGDWGTGVVGYDTGKLLTERTQPGEHAAIFHMGDIAYNMDDEQGAVGDDFLNQIDPISSIIPYMTVIGNHDMGYGNKTEYISRFRMPVNEDN